MRHLMQRMAFIRRFSCFKKKVNQDEKNRFPVTLTRRHDASSDCMQLKVAGKLTDTTLRKKIYSQGVCACDV
jgi:serine protease inhibitor ecotin